MMEYHEKLYRLEKKKDNGEAMSGHERMELEYLTEIVLLKDKILDVRKCLMFIADNVQPGEPVWKKTILALSYIK